MSVQGEGKMGLKKNEGGTEASFVLPRAKCKFHIFTIFPQAFFGQQGLRFKPKCTSKNDSESREGLKTTKFVLQLKQVSIIC